MDLTKTVLGIELGSTRIKAVLIDQQHRPIASGDYEWENRLVNGIWTYSMESVHTGLLRPRPHDRRRHRRLRHDARLSPL